MSDSLPDVMWAQVSCRLWIPCCSISCGKRHLRRIWLAGVCWSQQGPTVEPVDPVRYITNHSTGKMGYAIAGRAALRGAEVTLVTGPVSMAPPPFMAEVVSVGSAADMFDAVTERAPQQDIIIKAAAVADYTPAEVSREKINKADSAVNLPLVRTRDILGWLGEHRRKGQFLCGFSMETENMLENSRAKLMRKHVDMIVANDLRVEGSGFGTDTNVVTLITEEDVEALPKMGKEEVAGRVLDRIRDYMSVRAEHL